MKYRILIVEDNIMLAGQQKKWLEKSGQKQVEMFVDAIENSANNRPVRTPVSARQIKGEAELRKFMEKRKKADVGQK